MGRGPLTNGGSSGPQAPLPWLCRGGSRCDLAAASAPVTEEPSQHQPKRELLQTRPPASHQVPHQVPRVAVGGGCSGKAGRGASTCQSGAGGDRGQRGAASTSGRGFAPLSRQIVTGTSHLGYIVSASEYEKSGGLFRDRTRWGGTVKSRRTQLNGMSKLPPGHLRSRFLGSQMLWPLHPSYNQVLP